MKKELLLWICCPYCKNELDLKAESVENGEIKEGQLVCSCGKEFIIRDYIPRFVDDDKYVKNFSFEWKRHRQTQLDSANRNNVMAGTTRRTFEKRVDFPLSQLRDKVTLDVGCGMGRYAEIAAEEGAQVVGMDLSLAVDAAFENIGRKANVNFIQADIFNLPFKCESFDFIYSFGVLHHTPDCYKAFSMIPGLLKKGGKFSVLLYSAYNKGIVYMSNFWRIFTTKIPKKILYYAGFLLIPLYYLYKIPVVGNVCKMVFPLPMWSDWRWRVLDTFDWYSPKYQSKHTHWEVFGWFKKHGIEDIFIGEDEISLQGTKKLKIK